MSYKPDEKDWMAYLYGELEDVEKQKFEEYILLHPEARQELEKFQQVRTMLAGAEDKEVIAPPIFIGANYAQDSRNTRQYFWNTHFFRGIASVAASLLLLILVGKLAGAQLSISNSELRLSFGEDSNRQQEAPVKQAPAAHTLSVEQVQGMINNSLEKNNTLVQASLAETQEKLDASIRSSLALSSGQINQLVREASSASQEQVRQYVEGIRTENMQQVKDYFQLTSTEQKKYIENLLVDFAKYLQQQRNNDLQLVQTRMNSLEQNTDLFKQETEQILSSIITTVGNPVPGETKN